MVHSSYESPCTEKEGRRTATFHVGFCSQGVQYMDAPVAHLRHSLKLAHLKGRRQTADLIFLYKIVNGDTDFSELTEFLDYRVPRGTRLRDIFGRRIQNTRYSYMSSIPRILREENLPDNSIGVFGSSM
ncbi:hypothetical protein J6590_065422 [Homalodisca vitripennis]|nr:hypothetical protein J6590_065422 [Homalodisca vitripennis]